METWHDIHDLFSYNFHFCSHYPPPEPRFVSSRTPVTMSVLGQLPQEQYAKKLVNGAKGKVHDSYLNPPIVQTWYPLNNWPPKQNTNFWNKYLRQGLPLREANNQSQSVWYTVTHPSPLFLPCAASKHCTEEKMLGSFAPLLPSAIITRGSAYWKHTLPKFHIAADK